MKKSTFFSAVGLLVVGFLIAVCISMVRPNLIDLGPAPKSDMAAASEGQRKGMFDDLVAPPSTKKSARLASDEDPEEEHGSIFDDLKPPQSALAGLEGVQVYVNSLRKDRQSYGLTTEQLQIDAELELRRYGIRVLSWEEVLKTPRQPAVLLISVLWQPSLYADLTEGDVCACSITVQLFEDMRLERNSRISCRATAWGRKSVNAIPIEFFAKMVREGLHDLTTAFINDYLAANPKN